MLSVQGDTVRVARSSLLALFCFAGMVWQRPVWSAVAHYDLGGPCHDVPGPGPFLRILQAKKTGAWDEVVELQKASVRASCANEYQWYELVSALLQAHRQTEAVQVLEEMEARGFDLNPSIIGGMHPDVQQFMETPVFKASPVGIRIERLKKAADERRAVYREALKKLPNDQKPPDNYIAKGACPFECCRYGNWTVLEDTDLVAAPGSKRVVGRAQKGSRVVGLTGEVHLKPEPVVVLMGGGELPKDSIAFVLDYGGEGEGSVYTRGKVVHVFLGVAEYCFRVSESCWGQTLAPVSERKKEVWWVKIRLPNGVIGWTDNADNFGDKDACG